jgi:hypothetical protein
MPNSKHQLVRLLATVICSCVALWFTVIHTDLQRHFFEAISKSYPVHPSFSWLVMLFIEHGSWVFVVPSSALAVGIWLLYQRPQALAVFEILIFGVWLLTIIVVGFWFIGWQGIYMDLEWRELLYIKNRDKM